MNDDIAIIEEFKRLTLEILNHDGPRGILVGLVGELVEILDQFSEVRSDRGIPFNEGETFSTDGLAISPEQAAMCAGEELRTTIFLRGLHAAITESVKLKSLGEPVRILYAGSGPYAALATPLMALFSADQVQFTVLDIHSASIESAKTVIKRLGLIDRVEAFVVADACSHSIQQELPPDIILSETMSTALEKEPQVAIMRHLLGQAPNAVIVPESVRLDAFLVDTSAQPEHIIPEGDALQSTPQVSRNFLGTVFELNAETIKSWQSLSGDQLPAGTIDVPVQDKTSLRPFIFTTITTHSDYVLRTHDCNLTGIREIAQKRSFDNGGNLRFHYQLGSDPKLVC